MNDQRDTLLTRQFWSTTSLPDNYGPYGPTQIPSPVFNMPPDEKLVTAVKHDAGKRDWSLLPYDSIEEIVKVLEFGATKYARDNWKQGEGFKYSRTFNAIMRHMLAFMRGEDKDPETGLSHWAHVGCNVLFILHFVLNKDKYATCDDR